MKTDTKRRPAESLKHEATRKPGKDDVHEQREHAQPREGVVHAPSMHGTKQKRART